MATTTTDSGINSNTYNLTPFGTVKQEVKKPAATTSDGSKSDTALQGLGDNFNQFLKLLTTQMQNQDPLKPMDTNEMTNQLVQFANVEQNIQTNSHLEKLVGMQQAYTATGNLFYLNRSVQYEGDKFEYVDGMTAIELGYELESSAKSVRVDILDSQGRIVSSSEGNVKGGERHRFAWDMKDDEGRAVQPGTYRINVAPVAEKEGETIKATTYTVGTVTAVDYSDTGEAQLMVNGTKVPVSKVVAVR